MSPHCQRCHKCPLILATRRTIQSHEKLQQCPLLPQNNLSRVELQSTSIVLNLIEIEKQSRHSFIILWCSPLEWRIRIISLCHLTVKNRLDYPFVCNACDNQLIAVWIEDKPIWHMTWKWLLCFAVEVSFRNEIIEQRPENSFRPPFPHHVTRLFIWMPRSKGHCHPRTHLIANSRFVIKKLNK